MHSDMMLTPSVVSSHLLQGLSGDECRSVLTEARQLKFIRNSVAVNQGHPGDRLFLLAEGRARFFFVTADGTKILLRWIIPGQIFGASALLTTQSSYLVGTEMVRDSIVLVWDRPTIKKLAERYSRLLENVLVISEDYLSWYIAAHEALTTHNARERLAHLLSRLAESIGQKGAGGIELDVTNEELASAANVTTFTVSRLLSQWQRRGAIAKSRNRLVICSPKQIL